MTVQNNKAQIPRDANGKRLTPNELKVYEAVVDLLRKPWAPTIHEIAKVCGIHPGTVGNVLMRLQAKGLVVREYHKMRSVELVEPPPGGRLNSA